MLKRLLLGNAHSFRIVFSVFFSAEDTTFKGQETLSDSDCLILHIFPLFGIPCYISLFPSSLSSDQDKFKPPFNTHTEGTIEIVRIKRVEFREYVRALLFPFPQGQSKLSVVSGCP